MAEIKRPPKDGTPEYKIYRVLALGSTSHVGHIERACKIAGHEVVPVTSIAQGLQFLEDQDHVDVIVAETHLELESVFDFLRAVKAEPKHSNVRFMMLCTDPSDLAKFANESVEQAASLLGVDKYLLMNVADTSRLAKEIDVLMPETLPQKELRD